MVKIFNYFCVVWRCRSSSSHNLQCKQQLGAAPKSRQIKNANVSIPTDGVLVIMSVHKSQFKTLEWADAGPHTSVGTNVWSGTLCGFKSFKTDSKGRDLICKQFHFTDPIKGRFTRKTRQIGWNSASDWSAGTARRSEKPFHPPYLW